MTTVLIRRLIRKFKRASRKNISAILIPIAIIITIQANQANHKQYINYGFNFNILQTITVEKSVLTGIDNVIQTTIGTVHNNLSARNNK